MALSDYVGRQYGGPVPCFSFVREFLADRGLILPDYSCTELERVEMLRAHIAEHAEQVASPTLADVALMAYLGRPQHIGVMIDARRVMHHTDKFGVVIERTNDIRWRGRICSYWRPRFPAPVQPGLPPPL